MKYFLVGFIICFFIFLHELPFVSGFMHTPKDQVYLGTLHFAPDYFYYLSQIAQGKDHILSSRILYTTEKLPLVFIGWQGVLAGKLLGNYLSPIAIYQLTLIIYLAVFLSLSYYLITKIIGNGVYSLVAFIFFLFASPLPILTFIQGRFNISYSSYWYNLGEVLARFGYTPHHLLGNIFMVALILLIFHSYKFYQVSAKVLFAMAVFSLLLASINPVHWGLVCLTTLGYSFSWEEKVRIRFIPVLLIFLGGLIAVVYSKHVFSLEPYSYSSIWEATQQIPINFKLLFLGSGPVIPLGILGIYFFLKKRDTARLWIVIFILLCVVLFFSNLGAKLHFTNARFWPGPIYIFWGILAASFLKSVSGKFILKPKLFVFIATLVFLLLSLPHTTKALQDKLKVEYNEYYYLPQDVYLAEIWAGKNSLPADNFLVPWPLNESFPAITGRKTLFGYQLFTIDAEKKGKEADDFFSARLNEAQMQEMLAKYKLNYVLAYKSNKHIAEASFLKMMYENESVGIYKVN